MTIQDTVPLYHDAYCTRFQGRVLSCAAKIPDGKKKNAQKKPVYEVILDQTAFYPEGGGQNGDTGVLWQSAPVSESFAAEKPGDESGCPESGSVHVIDTQIQDGVIRHLTDAPLPEGSIVKGEIDWDRRFDLMQNHTGEHIVSGLIHERFGYENVGFHMGSDVITIDLSGVLTDEALAEIEEEANQVVWRNVPVQTEVIPEEEAAERIFRSKKELHGLVRIVTIPGADVCACCGTHVAMTGEIGLIRLLDAEHFRGGSRVRMLCGRRALVYTREVDAQNHQISVLLSAKPMQTAAAVRRMKEELAEASFQLADLEAEKITALAERTKGVGDCLYFLPEQSSPQQVQRLAVAIMERCKGRCFVFSEGENGQRKYAGGIADGDVRTLVKTMNAALSGRGGGKPHFAQGMLQASKEEIAAFFQKEGSWRIFPE